MDSRRSDPNDKKPNTTLPYKKGPNNEMTYNQRDAVTRQTVSLEERELRWKIAESIAAVLDKEGNKKDVEGGVKPQTDYNIGMIGYIDQHGEKNLLIALSGENETDLLANALSKEEIIKKLGKVYGVHISLVIDTGKSAEYYGYGTSREAISIAHLSKGESVKTGLFYYQLNETTENYELFYINKYNKEKGEIPKDEVQELEPGLCKIALPLEPKEQHILNEYANASERRSMPQEIFAAVIKHRNNISKYKCSEPKLAAERQKSVLFSEGFMDGGESHFAVSKRGGKGIEVKPQCSCSECQYRTEKFQQPLKPLVGLSILLNTVRGSRSSSPERRQPIDQVPENYRGFKNQRARERQQDKIERATQLIEGENGVMDMYAKSEKATSEVDKKKYLAAAAKAWAQAMRLDGGIALENYIQSARDSNRKAAAINALRVIAIAWFKQGSELHFQRGVLGKDSKGYQKALTFYTQLIPLMEANLAQKLTTSSVEEIQQAKLELADCYLKRACARLEEIDRLDRESDFRTRNSKYELNEASRDDYKKEAIEVNVKECLQAIKKLGKLDGHEANQWAMMLEHQAKLCLEEKWMRESLVNLISLAISNLNLPFSPQLNVYFSEAKLQLAEWTYGEAQDKTKQTQEIHIKTKNEAQIAQQKYSEAQTKTVDTKSEEKATLELLNKAQSEYKNFQKLTLKANDEVKEAQTKLTNTNRILNRAQKKTSEAHTIFQEADKMVKKFSKSEEEAKSRNENAEKKLKQAEAKNISTKKRKAESERKYKEASTTLEIAKEEKEKYEGKLKLAQEKMKAMKENEIKAEERWGLAQINHRRAPEKIEVAKQKVEKAKQELISAQKNKEIAQQQLQDVQNRYQQIQNEEVQRAKAALVVATQEWEVVHKIPAEKTSHIAKEIMSALIAYKKEMEESSNKVTLVKTMMRQHAGTLLMQALSAFYPKNVAERLYQKLKELKENQIESFCMNLNNHAKEIASQRKVLAEHGGQPHWLMDEFPNKEIKEIEELKDKFKLTAEEERRCSHILNIRQQELETAENELQEAGKELPLAKKQYDQAQAQTLEAQKELDNISNKLKEVMKPYEEARKEAEDSQLAYANRQEEARNAKISFEKAQKEFSKTQESYSTAKREAEQAKKELKKAETAYSQIKGREDTPKKEYELAKKLLEQCEANLVEAKKTEANALSKVEEASTDYSEAKQKTSKVEGEEELAKTKVKEALKREELAKDEVIKASENEELVKLEVVKAHKQVEAANDQLISAKKGISGEETTSHVLKRLSKESFTTPTLMLHSTLPTPSAPEISTPIIDSSKEVSSKKVEKEVEKTDSNLKKPDTTTKKRDDPHP